MKKETPRIQMGMNSTMEFHQIEDFRRIELTCHGSDKKIYQGISGIDRIVEIGKSKAAGVKNARYKNATQVWLKNGSMYTVAEKYSYIKKIMDEGPLFILKGRDDK